MGTLYIDRKDCYIKIDGNALAFYVNGKREGIVPIEPLKRVIFIGNMRLDTSVIKRFSEHGIKAIFLSGKRLKFCGMLQGSLHKNGLLRLKQYEKAKSDFAKQFSNGIVKRKIESQINLLKEALESRQDLRFYLLNALNSLKKTLKKIDSAILEIDSLKGIEGSASAIYFNAYTKLFPASLNFSRRTRRPPLDPVNAMLSLCYTLLHFEIVREIEAIGLDPFIGFYHEFEYARESLACDIMEIFRANVDRFVWNIFRTREFFGDDFTKDSKNRGCYLKKEKRKNFYPLYESWAKSIRPLLTEEVRNIAKNISDGEDTILE